MPSRYRSTAPLASVATVIECQDPAVTTAASVGEMTVPPLVLYSRPLRMNIPALLGGIFSRV